MNKLTIVVDCYAPGNYSATLTKQNGNKIYSIPLEILEEDLDTFNANMINFLIKQMNTIMVKKMKVI